MSTGRPLDAKEKLLTAATELFRRRGFTATSVDEVCQQAGVTKGAFFHHFESKEAVAEACLRRWDEGVASMEKGASLDSVEDPVARLVAYMDFYIKVFGTPKMLKSCLAGTTVQEVSHTHPVLRDAANACFVRGAGRFKALLDEACRRRRKRLDTGSISQLWLAAMQGSIVLAKASGDESVIPRSLEHVKAYVQTLLGYGGGK